MKRIIHNNTELEEIIFQCRAIPATTEQNCTKPNAKHIKLTAPDQ